MADLTCTAQNPFVFLVSGEVNDAMEIVADLRPSAMAAAGGALLASENLADLDDAPTALTNLGGTATGVAVFTADNTPAAQAAIGAGESGSAVFIAATPADARTALGSTTVGDAVFVAASAGAAQTALGAGATGSALFATATAAAAYTALGLGDYADDAAAATGGVAVGFAYHTAGALRTRMA